MNNYSISTDGLATALQKSVSALKTANNDMDEAIALVTAGNQVVQDPDSVGAGLRTIALRITGTESAREELEELGEDVDDFVVQTTAKSQQTIKDFTKVASNNFQGFDILDDNGNFKSTYEILLGISEIYKEIEETDKEFGTNMKNGLLEALAGKNRANIAASILQNPELLKSVYESSQDSTGSAENELNAYLDSIEGKIAQFTNEVQEFWYNLISSETVKGIIDIGTTAVDIIGDVVGALGEVKTVIAALGAGFGIKFIASGELKNYISGLQQVQTAINNISDTHAIIDGATNLLTSDSLNSLKSAVYGLSQEQALLVLSTKNLSQAQQEQVLSAAGLLATEKQLTAAQISERLAKELNSKADAEALLIKAGIVTQKELEENATIKVTAAKLNEAIANGTLSASDAGVIAGALGITGVNTGTAISFDVLTASIWANVKALAAWLATSPAGWITLAIGGIVALTTAVSHSSKAYDKLIEKSEQAADTITSLKDDFANTEETVSGMSERFAELAQGVDMLTGKNLSLSTEDYEEFLNLSNQLAELFPTLSRNYTENGDAIVQLSGDTDTMVSSLENLVEAQRQLTNQKIANELPDLYEGIAAKSERYNASLELLEYQKEQLKSIGELDLETGLNTFLTTGTLKITDITDEDGNVITATSIEKKYEELFNELEINYSKTADYDSTNDRFNITGYNLVLNMSDDEIQKVKANISSGMQEIAEAYNDEVETLNTEILTNKNENKANWSSLLSSISSWLSTDFKFVKMTDGMQSIAQSMINNLNFDELNFEKWEDLEKYISDNIIDPLFNLKDEDKAKVQEAWDNLFALDINKESADEYVEQVNEYIDVISEALNLSDEKKEQLKINLGFEIAADDADESLESDLQSLKDTISKKVSDVTDEQLGSLTVSDLQIAATVVAKVDEGNKISWDDLMTGVDFSKYLGDVATSASEILKDLNLTGAFDEMLGDNTAFSKVVDEYIDDVNKLNVALQKIKSGNWEDSDIVKLKEEFPEVAWEAENLESQIKSLLNIKNTNMMSDFASQFDEVDSDEAVANLVAFQDAVLELGEVVGSTAFSIDIDAQKTNIENLLAAINESAGSTGLSTESIDNLKAMYSDLEGYDPSVLFENTEHGIQLNIDALEELQDAYEDTIKTGYKEELQDLQQELENLEHAQESVKPDSDEFNALEQKRLKIIDEMNSVKSLAAQYEGLTSSYNKWLNAQSTTDQDDKYNNVSEWIDTLEEQYKSGRIGTDDFKMGVQFMYDEDLDFSNMSSAELIERYQKGIGTMKKFFTGDVNGYLNFLNVAKDVTAKMGEDWVTLNKETGEWEFNIAEGGEQALVDAINANTKYQMSVEQLETLFEGMEAYHIKVNFDDAIASFDELQTKIEETDGNLKKLGVEPVEIDIYCDADEIDSEIDKANEALEKAENKEITADYTVEMQEEEIAHYNAEIDALVQRKIELEQPIFMSLDASSVKEGYENAYTLLTNYQTAADKVKELELKGASATEIAEANKTVTEYGKQLLGLPKEIKTDLGIDEKDTIDTLEEKIKNNQITVPVEVEADYKTTEELYAKATEAKGALDSIDGGKYSVDFDMDAMITDTKDAEEKLKQIKSYIDTVNASDVDPDVQTAQLEYATACAETLVSSMNQPAFMELDVTKVDASCIEALELLKTYQTAVNHANALSYLGMDTTEADQAVNELAAQILALDENTRIQLGFTKDDDSIEEIKAAIEADKVSIPSEIIPPDESTTDIINVNGEEITVTVDTIGDDLVKSLKAAIDGIEDKTVTITATTVGKEELDALKTSITNLSMKPLVPVNVSAMTTGKENVDALVASINNLSDKTITALADVIGTDLVNGLKTAIDALYDKTVTAKANVYGTQDVKNLKSAIDKLYNKTVTVTNVTKKVTEANGTTNIYNIAHLDGTVMSMWNNYRSSIGAYAKGADWTLPRNESALVNEVGTESIVRDGKWFPIPGGAHVEQLKKGDIIFSAKQTEELMKLGKVISGGGHGRIAHADGTAFNMLNAHSGGTAFGGMNAYSVTGGGAFYVSGNVTTTSNGSSKKSSSSSNSSSASEEAEEFEEILDWIERKIKDIERDIDNLDQTASATYKSWTERNSALADEFAKVTEEISIQQQAYERYMQEADKVSLSDKYKKLVQEGKIDIETITDEDLANKISEYQEWYDKAIDCQDAVQDLQDNLVELTKTRFDNVVQQFEDLLSVIEHTLELTENAIDKVETEGYIVSVEMYKSLKKQQEEQLATLQDEREALQAQLEDAMSKPVTEGGIEKYSEDWYIKCHVA